VAAKVVHVSDLSGQQADQTELGRLTVVEHPEFAELPVTLEALPKELEGLKSSEQLVRLEWLPPGARKPERYTIPLEDFNRLAEGGNMNPAVMEAIANQHQARGRARRAGLGGRVRGRVDYASPEHAGEPHRGRITEAEKTYVRDHLTQVNERLRANGVREIDPKDRTMQERYGLN